MPDAACDELTTAEMDALADIMKSSRIGTPAPDGTLSLSAEQIHELLVQADDGCHCTRIGSQLDQAITRLADALSLAMDRVAALTADNERMRMALQALIARKEARQLSAEVLEAAWQAAAADVLMED